MGVASATNAVETIPTGPPIWFWNNSAMVSTRGSSKAEEKGIMLVFKVGPQAVLTNDQRMNLRKRRWR